MCDDDSYHRNISLQKEAADQHFYHHGSSKEKQLSLYYQPSVQSAFAAQVNGSRGRGHFIGVGRQSTVFENNPKMSLAQKVIFFVADDFYFPIRNFSIFLSLIRLLW